MLTRSGPPRRGRGRPDVCDPRPPVPAAVFDPSPLPFVALMALGFLVGVAGHVYRSRVAIAAGIALVLIATVLLPLAVYVSSD